jgi:hypothetical protein
MDVPISQGGQISLPAAIRRRWSTRRVLIEDLGDRIIVRPIPEDPVAAAKGALRRPGRTAERDRQRLRREEQRVERGR